MAEKKRQPARRRNRTTRKTKQTLGSDSVSDVGLDGCAVAQQSLDLHHPPSQHALNDGQDRCHPFKARFGCTLASRPSA